MRISQKTKQNKQKLGLPPRIGQQKKKSKDETSHQGRTNETIHEAVSVVGAQKDPPLKLRTTVGGISDEAVNLVPLDGLSGY